MKSENSNTARRLVLLTALVAWLVKIVVCFLAHGAWSLMASPAVGGFYPWSLSSTRPGFNEVAIVYWDMGELVVFTVIALTAYFTRSWWLAVACSTLWIGSIVIATIRFLFD